MGEMDVIVCGAGTAGITAALAAARSGARTLLLERASSIGGTISRAFVYPMMTFHATLDHPVVAGIAQELVDLAVVQGLSPGHVRDTTGTATTLTPLEPQDFAACAEQLIARSDIHVRTGVDLLGVVLSDQRLSGLRVATPDGEQTFFAKVFIDATGNGDLAVMAGASFVYGRQPDQLAQPLTRMLLVSGVDFGLIRHYMQQHPDQFVLSASARAGHLPEQGLAVCGFFDQIRQVQAREHKLLFRDRVLCFQMRDGRAALNMTRLTGVDGTDPQAVSAASDRFQVQVDEVMDVLVHHIPGFSQASLEAIAPEIGVRETRHIQGVYTLTGEDVMAGVKFPDGIACGAFPIDIHSPDGADVQVRHMPSGTYYNIPYRCLLPRGVDGLLLAGRCISATHEASASARVTPTCMALGQAAGVAAAQSARQGVEPKALSVVGLQSQLRAVGVIIA